MFHQFLTSLKLLIIFTFLTGILYPIAITFIAQLTFSHKANGSLIFSNDKPIGSHLIGQYFNDPKYFWGRPSATPSYPYNAPDSAGSNFGPTNKAWLASIKNRLSQLQSSNPNSNNPNYQPQRIPLDLLTASGSGLDPHISIEAAQYQIPRIAEARNLPKAAIQELVSQATEGHRYSLLGTPRVNFLKLNLSLDALQNY